MKVKELLDALKDMPSDADVVFDSEAVCFETHWIGVSSVSHVSPDDYDGKTDHVVLHWDYNVEKYKSNKDQDYEEMIGNEMAQCTHGYIVNDHCIKCGRSVEQIFKMKR